MVKVLGHHTLYRDVRFHAAFPSIVMLPQGGLLLAFRRARDPDHLLPQAVREKLNPFARIDHLDPRSHIALLRLDADTLNAVGEPGMLPIDPEAADQDPSLLLTPEGLLLASFCWYPVSAQWAGIASGHIPVSGSNEVTGCHYVPWGGHTSFSPDYGETWHYHHRFLEPDGGFGGPLHPELSKSVVGGLRGQAIYSDGLIRQALYGGAPHYTVLFDAEGPDTPFRMSSIIARDEERRIAFQEPALCTDGSGRLACFMRTQNAGGRLASAYSEDNGQSWSPYRLHDVIGHPFHPLVLADGRVLLSYGYRAEPYGVRVRLLDDLWQDPDSAKEIIVRDDATCADVGYPWAVQLSEKRVLLSYYETDAEGTRIISGTVLEI